MGTMQCYTKNPIGIKDIKMYYSKVNLRGNSTAISFTEKNKQNKLLRPKNNPMRTNLNYENPTFFLIL